MPFVLHVIEMPLLAKLGIVASIVYDSSDWYDIMTNSSSNSGLTYSPNVGGYGVPRDQGKTISAGASVFSRSLGTTLASGPNLPLKASATY